MRGAFPRLALIFFLALNATGAMAPDWRTALPGWQYEFPRDHHSHPDFKTEWWYFTGNLQDAGGRRFGYELTFFRQGVRPPGAEDHPLSRFIVKDVKFAHFTISDLDGQHFYVQGKTSRGSFGEAGFDRANDLAWIDDWQLLLNPDGSFDLVAETGETALRLHLQSAKPPVVHGINGVSAKATDAGHASHYYSETRLNSAGELRVRDRKFVVTGESWFDHEWATNQLAPDQVGWNWLCVQLADGSELMLYQMRLASGRIDPASSGSLIAPNGTVTHLPANSFQFYGRENWKSSATGTSYPLLWRVSLPDRHLELTVTTPLKDQELVLPPLTYWEGTIEAKGSANEKPITGRGYLEMTGYAAPLQELSR